jgi:monoterpene epsilon-lactone hydrolase
MSREQRAKIDAMLRRPRPGAGGPASVEEFRAEFKAIMSQMIVPDGLRTTETTLGARPALRIESGDGASAGTILYFHGGVTHVFQGFAGILDEADQALDRAALFVTQHVHTP